jgi:hypothetical protein
MGKHFIVPKNQEWFTRVIVPQNHACGLMCVVAIWDGIKGVVMRELSDVNAYVPFRKTDQSEHTTKESMVAEYHRLEELSVSQRPDGKRGFQTEETYLLSFFSHDGRVHTVVVPNFDITIMRNSDMATVCVHGAITVPDWPSVRCVYLDIANDPTAKWAGSPQSLGYYCWRIELKEPVITAGYEDKANPLQKAPLFLTCKSDGFLNEFTRTCRRPHHV